MLSRKSFWQESAHEFPKHHLCPITITISIPIPIPTTLEEQKQVVDHLDMLTEQIESLQGTHTLKLSALDELKKSLLHQAFTGQL